MSITSWNDSMSSANSVNVRDAAALQAAAADFIARHGTPNIVIANAGISIGTLTEFAEDIESFQEVIDINVVGMVKTFQPFLAAMRAAGSGALVGIASVAGYRGLPGAAAILGVKNSGHLVSGKPARQTAYERYHVITICPGYIATPMTANTPI